jgi:hypothetical protein
MVVHAYNPYTQEASEAEGWQVLGQAGPYSRILSPQT